MAEAEVSSLEKLQADPILGEFIGVSKSETEYVEAVLAAKATAKTYAKLQEGIVALEKEIQSQVSAHHEELLAQVNIIRDLEDMLLVVNEGIETLDSSLARVQQQLQEPYEELVQKTEELRRMLAALEILRRTLRFSFVCSQLRRHVGAGKAREAGGKAVVASSRELPKAASCLLELEQIRRNSDLSGVELVEREMEWIVKVRNEVQTRARQMLVQGLETQNQSEVAQALQVFHNLQALAPTVSYTRSIIEKRASDSIHDVLDFSALERAHTGTPGAAQQTAWRAALWTRMEKLVDVLHQCSVQVWHLQRILQKMKEHGSRSTLLDLVVQEDAAGQTVTKKFWAFLAATLASELENAVKKSQFIDTTFVTEFPKLLRVFTEFLKRLQAHFEVKQGKDPSFAEDKRLLLGSLAKFETAFLTRTLSRLVEPINRSMPPNSRSVPSLDEVSQIAKVITTELDSANSSHHLSVCVSKCVAQALGIFVKRCEAVRAKEDEAFTLSEKANSGQVRNAMLFNSVHQLHTTLGELAKQQTGSVQEVLNRSLQGLDQLSRDLLDPLFARTTLVIERSMLTMHQSQYGIRGDGSADEERSKYMQILQRQLHVFQNVALSPYTYCPLLAEKIKRFVERVLVFFVRQASLVRPLSDAGKLRLTGDMAQLELALGPLRQIKSLGEPYIALRALRPFLFREVNEICAAPELKQLRGVDVMHQLFSRGPEELRSPHQLNDWSLAKYSAWLDKAAGKDVWTVIQRSLDAYAAKVNERGESHYDPIYPVMRELGPKLLLH